MTATVDELCTLLESGWTPEQINRLVLVRWLLTQGYNGNLLLTQELLRHRITIHPSTPSLSFDGWRSGNWAPVGGDERKGSRRCTKGWTPSSGTRSVARTRCPPRSAWYHHAHRRRGRADDRHHGGHRGRARGSPRRSRLASRSRRYAANTDDIYVGDSSVDSASGFVLAAGETLFVGVADLATIYVDSAADGEGVSYAGS